MPLSVLFATAEVAPLAKVGGLADVAAALPKALKQRGHDVRVILPAYAQIKRAHGGLFPLIEALHVDFQATTLMPGLEVARLAGEVPLYLVDQPELFDRERLYGYDDDALRFLFLTRAVPEVLRRVGWIPDVIHANDWHTALLPEIVRQDNLFDRTATLLTIHNLAYQGQFSQAIAQMAGLPHENEPHNFMARGVLHADAVNTVSPRYAREILTPALGEQLDELLRAHAHKLFGILNGIDSDVFNPASDPHLPHRYAIGDLTGKRQDKRELQNELALPDDPQAPLIGMVTRLADQKGFDLVAAGLPRLIQQTRAQLAVLGTGEPQYHELLRSWASRHPDRIAIRLTFDAALAQRIYAGSDLFLMPSRFEPCGLGQLIGLRYGSIPVVRATGGLADTIQDADAHPDTGNGFVFDAYDPDAMFDAIQRASHHFQDPDAWQRLMKRAMACDFSWRESARHYEDLYQKIVDQRRNQWAA